MAIYFLWDTDIFYSVSTEGFHFQFIFKIDQCKQYIHEYEMNDFVLCVSMTITDTVAINL